MTEYGLSKSPFTCNSYEFIQYGFVCIKYVKGMDLFDYFVENYKNLTDRIVLGLFKQMADIIHHLHSEISFCHLDLKLENFMIDKETNKVMLIDFGMAEDVATLGKGLKGTPAYMPPEVAQHNDGQVISARGDKADMWCLGMILFSLAFLKMPFREDKVNRRVFYRPIKSVLRDHPEVVGSLDKTIVECLEKLLASEPSDRPSSVELIKILSA